MFYIKRTFKFDAAHQLPDHKGKCKNLHGHTWEFTVCIASETNGLYSSCPNGIIIDFGDIKEKVQPLLERLDHQFLNAEIPTPTAEYISAYIYHNLKDALKQDGTYYLHSVSVKESSDTEVIYQW